MSYALVRKRGFGAIVNSASRYGGYGKRARMAYSAGRYLYKNRRTVIRAAKTIGRAYKKSRSRRIEGAQAQQVVLQSFIAGDKAEEVNVVRKNLWVEELKFANNINTGVNGAPNLTFSVKGFKLCYMLRNISDIPIHVHMAIVQRKSAEDTNYMGVNMFRSTDNNTDRTANFIDRSTEPAWDVVQDCQNLNTDRFNVLTHMRIKLNAGEEPYNRQQTGTSWIKKDKYFPLSGKKFAFETDSATLVSKPLTLLVWMETIFPSSGADNFNMNISTVTYLNKSKN